MGYDVFITNAVEVSELSRSPLDESAWQRIIAADPSLTLSTDDYYERRRKDGGIDRFYPTLWTGHHDLPPFWFIDGSIEIKSPDEETVIKMIEIAQKLGARVVDEEGCTYTLSSTGTLTIAPCE